MVWIRRGPDAHFGHRGPLADPTNYSERVSSPVSSAAQVTRRALARGRTAFPLRIQDARDRLIASDPGLFRLRRGLSAMLAVGSTALVEFAVFANLPLSPTDTLRAVMLGGMMAMTMATSVREPSRRPVVTSSLAMAVAAAVGATTSTLANPSNLLLLGLFVAMSFVAVWVRRFGQRWQARGFIAWQAYFFTLFISPPLTLLPYLVLSIAIAGAWVAVLLTTVLHDPPALRLRRMVTALRARLRATISVCLDLLERPDGETERLLRRQLIQASTVSLMVEAQLGKGSLPSTVSPVTFRRWLLNVEIGLEEVAGASVELAAPPPPPEHNDVEANGTPADQTPPSTQPIVLEMDEDSLSKVTEALRALGWGDFDAAQHAIARMPEDRAPLRRLAAGARVMLEAVEEWTSGRLFAPESPATGSAQASATRTASDDSTADGYEQVMQLIGDNLPGSQALATEVVSERRSHWWSPGRLRFQTRQALQAAVAAALALTVGEMLSPERSYWAAIAAFLTFTGASTAAENARRAVSRTLGTFLGLVMSLLLASFTHGNPVAAVALGLSCIFLAFYFQPVSNAVMIFFITIVLGQLYEMLHVYSNALMLLRLEETVVGAVSGILAATLVLPVPSMATARLARQQLMRHLATLLDECAELLWGLKSDGDLLTTMVQVGDDSRLAVATRSALLHVRSFGSQTPREQRLTSVLMACAVAARAVAQAVDAHPQLVAPPTAAACKALADECRRLAALDSLSDSGRDATKAPTPAEQVEALAPGMAIDTPVVLRRRIRRLAESLTLMTPRGGWR